MKRIKFLLIAPILFFISCTSVNTTNTTPTTTAFHELSQTMVTSKPASTTTLSPTFTTTPDIDALQTQGVNEPRIVATLGTKIPPGWYRQRVMFSPNGKLLVSSYGNKISLWEVGSYRKIMDFVVLNEKHGVERFAFSSDSLFLAATLTYYDDPKSHLFVWDTTTMELAFSTDLDDAILAKDSEYPYHYPATAIAFIPNSTRLVTANGNSIQIINVEDATELITIDLGQDMYASDISFPNDGRFIYVFMEWWKDNGITSYPRYQTKFALQIWDTNAHFLWRTLNFPDLNWAEEFKKLHGSYLVTRNPAKGTLEMMSLENEDVEQLPYRQGSAYMEGWDYITTDNRFVLFSRYFGTHNKDEQGIELWTIDSWQMLYKFQPDFYNDPDFLSGLGSDPGEIAVSNDNNWLAIVYAGQVFIYDIRILTAP